MNGSFWLAEYFILQNHCKDFLHQGMSSSQGMSVVCRATLCHFVSFTPTRVCFGLADYGASSSSGNYCWSRPCVSVIKNVLCFEDCCWAEAHLPTTATNAEIGCVRVKVWKGLFCWPCTLVGQAGVSQTWTETGYTNIHGMCSSLIAKLARCTGAVLS